MNNMEELLTKINEKLLAIQISTQENGRLINYLEKIILEQGDAIKRMESALINQPIEDKLFTEEEARKYLKCSSVTLWEKRKEGKLKSVKSGRINLYAKSALDEYLGLNKTNA